MRRIVIGVLLGGVLITTVGVLFRMGRQSDTHSRKEVLGNVERAERLARRQPAFNHGPVELLPLIDPGKDAIAGNWRIEGGILTCKASKDYVRLQVPCVPPTQYDLEVHVERRGPPEAFVLGLPATDHQVVVHLDGKLYGPDGKLIAPLCSSLRSIDGQTRNETLFPGPVFKESGISIIICSVRTSGIQVSVDDLRIITYQGDHARLSVPDRWAVPSRKALFVGAYDCEYRISRMTLRPVP